MSWLGCHRRAVDIYHKRKRFFSHKICVYWALLLCIWIGNREKKYWHLGYLIMWITDVDKLPTAKKYYKCMNLTQMYSCDQKSSNTAILLSNIPQHPSVERLFTSALPSVIPSLIVSLRINCHVPTLITPHTNYRTIAFRFPHVITRFNDTINYEQTQ